MNKRIKKKDTANTWQRQSAHHALANLELANLTCLPVLPGSTWPLLHTPHRFHTWEALHGALPWQGVFAPEAQDGNDPTSGDPDRIVREAFIEGFPRGSIDESTTAASFMVDMVRKYPGQVSIYSAGALTNVALAARLDASFAEKARELVVMGGYVDVNLLQVMGDVELANVNSDVFFSFFFCFFSSFFKNLVTSSDDDYKYDWKKKETDNTR